MKKHGENSIETLPTLETLSPLTRQDQKLLALVTEYFPIDVMTKAEKQALIDDRTGRIKRLLTSAFLSEKWREVDGVIHFIVTSDGTTGEQWITRLEKAGKKNSKEAKYILRSPDFKPTSGVTTEIVVLKGMLFSDDNRITANIRAEADKRGLTVLNAEAACLIREMFTDQDLADMGLYWIVVMHEPINDSGGNPSLLNANRNGDGSWLSAFYGNADNRWNRDDGFAFAGVQVALNA